MNKLRRRCGSSWSAQGTRGTREAAHILSRETGERDLPVAQDVEETREEDVEELGGIHVAVEHVDGVTQLRRETDLVLDVYAPSIRPSALPRPNSLASSAAGTHLE